MLLYVIMLWLYSNITFEVNTNNFKVFGNYVFIQLLNIIKDSNMSYSLIYRVCLK